MDMENLVRQHSQMLEIANKIRFYKDERQVQKDAAEISPLLSQLSGMLGVHLMSEDRFLYPKLTLHSERQIRETAQKFADEMGDLSKVFGEYKMNYLGAHKIAGNAGRFIADSQIVLTALVKRISNEDAALYPLLVK